MNMKKITKYIMVGVITAAVIISGGLYGKRYQMQQQLAEKVIRFHVLANSNQQVDQELKLLVRDAIGTYMQKQMQTVENKEECREKIMEWIPEVEQIAGEVVLEEGFSYPVKAELTECSFPVKTYGDYTFPAGTYEALKVTIGEGKGKNWWCVMYPNMCFENSMYEVVDEKSQKALREVLDEEEYQTVLNSGKYQVKLWILEYFR